MSITTTAPHRRRTSMSPDRTAALIAGVAYIATFIFSIPVKFVFWSDVLDEPDFVLGAGSDRLVPLGAAFEVLTGLGGVVSAVALYKVASRASNRAALGFVTTRVLEAAVIMVGVFAILTVHTLRTDVAGTAGADPDTLVTTGRALVSVHDWTFLFGPGLMASLNALLIGSVMYRARLLPRWIPTLGLIGAPLLLLSTSVTLFGGWEQLSSPAALLTLPIAVWEFSFGVYMVVKGLRPSPMTDPAAHAADCWPNSGSDMVLGTPLLYGSAVIVWGDIAGGAVGQAGIAGCGGNGGCPCRGAPAPHCGAGGSPTGADGG